MSESREPPPRCCAFCDAPFTARMTAWMGPDRPCACCGVVGHWPIALPPTTKPIEDLACDACGKVLYRAPGA